MINRPYYIKKLYSFKDKDLIKVVTGIRRCGKSTLFDLYIEELKKSGIKDNQIVRLNLEDPIYNNLDDYMKLYNYVMKKVAKNQKTYVFLDEVQNVLNFQKSCDGLYIHKNIDLYINGSNAYLLSGELATLLSGRYIEIKMLPLSFKEYYSYIKSSESLERIYLDYINKSSFPYALFLNSEDEIDDYLLNIYNTILVKDIITRKKIHDVSVLESVAKFMMANVGNILSVKKITDTLNSNGREVSVHTVENYLDALIDSFVFYKISRFDIKGKEFLQSGEKYYLTDVTLRYALLGRKNLDLGHVLENIVFLELKRRGYKVYVGKSRDKEIDFVTEDKEGFKYYQVSYTLRDEETLKRELSALESVHDHYPKYLLTMDIDPEVDYNGIRKMNVLDWLLDETK